MGIQINGQTDIVTSTTAGGKVTIPTATFPSVTDLNVTGIVTASNFSGNITGNVNSSGLSTFSSGVVVAAGSTSVPSISPSGDSNTGIFFPSPDTVAIGEGGVEVLRIDSNSNVGIGTISPATKLDVRQPSSDSGNASTAILFNGDDSATIWRAALKLRHNSNTTIVSGSSIGISFEPLSSTGSSFYGTAGIKAVRENATASNQDTALVFLTRSGSSNNTTDTEKVRIGSTGSIFIGSYANSFDNPGRLNVSNTSRVTTTSGSYVPSNGGFVDYARNEMISNCITSFPANNNKIMARNGAPLVIGDARSAWSHYSNLPNYLLGSLTHDCINNSTFTFTLACTMTVFLLRDNGWNAVDLTGWTLIESGGQIGVNAISNGRLYVKTLSAGSNTLSNNSAMYFFVI